MANTGSTDRIDRESRGLDIASSILVSVVLCLAAWTSPPAHVEGQVLDDVAAGGAGLAAGVVAVDLHELPAVPGARVKSTSERRFLCQLKQAVSTPGRFR